MGGAGAGQRRGVNERGRVLRGCTCGNPAARSSSVVALSAVESERTTSVTRGANSSTTAAAAAGFWLAASTGTKRCMIASGTCVTRSGVCGVCRECGECKGVHGVREARARGGEV